MAAVKSNQQDPTAPADDPAPDLRAELDLVARVRSGDAAACEAVVRTYGPRMLSVARRFLSREDDCEDAVQDAFVSAFKAIDSFAGEARLGTWLHRVIVNACLMRLRRRRKSEISIEPLLPTFQSDGHHTRPIANWDDEGFTRLSAAETRARVRACIDALPEPYRAVVLAREIEGLSTQEAAELLGCSPANVKTRLHRARQALRTMLQSAVLSG